MSDEITIPSGWLQTKEAGRHVGLSQARVIQLANRGVLRHIRTPWGRFIDPNSLTELATARARIAAMEGKPGTGAKGGNGSR